LNQKEDISKWRHIHEEALNLYRRQGEGGEEEGELSEIESEVDDLRSMESMESRFSNNTQSTVFRSSDDFIIDHASGFSSAASQAISNITHDSQRKVSDSSLTHTKPYDFDYSVRPSSSASSAASHRSGEENKQRESLQVKKEKYMESENRQSFYQLGIQISKQALSFHKKFQHTLANLYQISKV